MGAKWPIYTAKEVPMQINGYDSKHSADTHRITSCLHDHSTVDKRGGARMMASQLNEMQKTEHQEALQDGKFSLLAWLNKALSGGRGFLLRIWSDGEATDISQEGAKGANGLAEMAVGQLQQTTERTARTPEHNPALQNVQALQNAQAAQIPGNPYFAPLPDNKPKENMVQKMRVHFYKLSGQLQGHLPGKHSFQAKEESTKQDLRRHSRYRQEDIELECILTDDSYLLDSYDKKGEYSKLSPK